MMLMVRIWRILFHQKTDIQSDVCLFAFIKNRKRDVQAAHLALFEKSDWLTVSQCLTLTNQNFLIVAGKGIFD